MKQEFENIELLKNDAMKRFEISVNHHIAFVNYGEFENQIALVHTESAPELKGTGAAAALIEKTLQFIKESGKTLLPYCPFVFSYIKKHPEWKAIVDKSFIGFNKI